MRALIGVLIILIFTTFLLVVDLRLFNFHDLNSREYLVRGPEHSEQSQNKCLCFNQSYYEINHTTQATELKVDSRNVHHTSVNIMIMAGARTGSSFVGDFFRSNPTVFYLFEPLFAFRYIRPSPRMSVIGVNALAKMYDCDFSGYPKQWGEYFKRLTPNRFSPTMEMCAPLLLAHQTVRKCCQGAQHRVAKVIRLPDVRDIITLMESPTLNLKVINVVRDPRARMASFINMYYSKWTENKRESDKVRDVGDLNEYLLDEMKHYCEEMLRNYILFKANSSRAWKENFLIIRFEDVAQNPRTYANIMYSHVGIDVDNEVYKWIDNNTQVNNKQHGGFGTTRKSSAVVNDWRNRMTFKLVERIQDCTICREYMTNLHYIIAQNVTMLKDKTIPLLKSLN
ncbi:carbohydrate sulfotransferase 1-like [Glandiceps talaboti]